MYSGTVTFYAGQSDLVGCTVDLTGLCEPDHIENVCVPDCEDDLFERYDDLVRALPGCPGCNVIISYSAREACDGEYQDIQITGIAIYNESGAPATACNGCTYNEIYKFAIEQVIRHNAMGFEPFDRGECSEIWRVVKASCWAHTVTTQTPEQGGRKIEKWYACNSECCIRRLKVCYDLTGNLIVEDIGEVLPETLCTDLFKILYSNGFEIGRIPCEPNCSALSGWAEVFTKESVDQERMDEIYREYLEFEKGTDFGYTGNYSDGKYTLYITKSVGKILTARFYDVKGEILLTKDEALTGKYQVMEFGLDDISAGAYFLDLMIDGKVVGTLSFIVE